MGNLCLSANPPKPLAGVGLQAELQAAYQEGECVKRKVKQQEAEMEVLRRKFASREDEFELKYSKTFLDKLHQRKTLCKY